jgi:hypothetical protein
MQKRAVKNEETKRGERKRRIAILQRTKSYFYAGEVFTKICGQEFCLDFQNKFYNNQSFSGIKNVNKYLQTFSTCGAHEVKKEKRINNFNLFLFA